MKLYKFDKDVQMVAANLPYKTLTEVDRHDEQHRKNAIEIATLIRVVFEEVFGERAPVISGPKHHNINDLERAQDIISDLVQRRDAAKHATGR